MSALYLVGFIQAVFFSILILTKKRKYIKDYILILFILLYGFQLFFIYGLKTGLYNKYPFIVLTDFFYWTFLGPLLYKYIEFSINHSLRFRTKDLIHFIPAIIVFSSHADFIINHMYNTDLITYTNNNTSLFIYIGKYVFAFTNLFYYILSIILIRNHNKNIPDFFSNTKGVDLKLLNYLTHGFAVFIIFELFVILFGHYINNPFLNKIYSYSWIVLNVYIFGIGYFGYKHHSIFSDNYKDYYPLIFKKEIIEGFHKERKYSPLSRTQKYIKSGLDEKEREVLLKQVIKYMQDEKPFLNPDLNLKSLSEQLNTTPHKLSQVLNESLGKNFFDFINEYRIEEFKKILSNPESQKYSITPLAYDCGFNSISAFYNIFKKQTSLTPAEFRKMYIN